MIDRSHLARRRIDAANIRESRSRAGAAGRIIFSGEESAEQRLHPQDSQQAVRHPERLRTLRSPRPAIETSSLSHNAMSSKTRPLSR
jgi:hypothetical protein